MRITVKREKVGKQLFSVSTTHPRPAFHQDPATPVYTSPPTAISRPLSLVPSPSYLDYISLLEPSTFSHLSSQPFWPFPFANFVRVYLFRPSILCLLSVLLSDFCSLLFINSPSTCILLSHLVLHRLSSLCCLYSLFTFSISRSSLPQFTSTTWTKNSYLFCPSVSISKE